MIHKKFHHRYFLYYIAILFALLVGIIFYGKYNTSTQAAVTVDNTSRPTNGTSNTSWSHTVGTQSNRLLLVIINFDSADNFFPTTLTYNGLSLTKINKFDCRNASNDFYKFCRGEVYALLNPPTGAHTIAATFDNAMPTGFSAVAVSLYNVNQTTPFAFMNTATTIGSNRTPTLTLSGTLSSQFVINPIVVYGATNTISPGSAQTLLTSHNAPSGTGRATYLAIKPAGNPSTTLNWSVMNSGASSNTGMAIQAVPNPTATPTPTPPVPTPRTCTIVSDTSNSVVGGGNAAATYDDNPDWTASIPGSTWIWSSFLVANPGLDDTREFRKQLYVKPPVLSAVLEIAADNGYWFSMNGNLVFSDPSGGNHSANDTYNFTSNFIDGMNTFTFRVTNWGIIDKTPQTNPAGLLYKLTVTAADCGAQLPTPTPTPTRTPTPTPTNTPTPTPTPTPALYTINGSVFDDQNSNGRKDVGEANYSGRPSINTSRGTVTTRTDGTYTISNLTAGLVTVSFTSLPSGYKITSPLNGPPPSYQVTVGPGCNTNGALGALCQ